MKVLIIGGGGREHALGWKIKQSPLLSQLYFAPGNPGTASLGENLTLKNQDEILDFAKSQAIDLVVVGPEQPLVEGMADALDGIGVPCFGPSQAAAELEGSKTFAKAMMEKAGVPTAAYQEFDQYQAAVEYAQNQEYPLVVKADGLAAGKGVTICQHLDEAKAALKEALVDKRFGSSGNKVVIEQFLKGVEVSFHVISDGTNLVPLVSAQDHKALYEGNKGPNTGGMGTFAPSPLINAETAEKILNRICQPVVNQMREENIPFRGVLFAGLMITKDGPYVLEFNCRFGDPETQVIMPLLDFDLLPVLHGAAKGSLTSDAPKTWKSLAAVCVTLASAGYPRSSSKGDRITGIHAQDQSQIFHAGTAHSPDGYLMTNGGRVLSVTAWADKLGQARQDAYGLVSNIHFDGMQYRKDIGSQA
jgi:phosphoribosylamine--glycine ligase